MSRFFVSPDSPEGWREGLAKAAHWKRGYSAHSLAYTWHPADGFPARVAGVLAQSALGPLEFVVGIPEYKVALPGGDTASQTDLFVLARTARGKKVVIAVEGKAEETFGPTVAEWRVEASGGKRARLAHLLSVLELSDDGDIGALRYQLLHRTVSALMEAERLHASFAAMLVHSFSPTRRWHEDLAAFVTALGSELPTGDAVVECGTRRGRTFYVGWVSDEHPVVPA